MTLTAVVTAHNYGRYLDRCLTSCRDFGVEQVLVFDDGSTDSTPRVLAAYPEVVVERREVATGDPIWGSNLGIERATGTHLIFLDADNYLVADPHDACGLADYAFADIEVVGERGAFTTRWDFSAFETDAEDAYRAFQASAPYPRMPFPWGGVWRTAWLADKRWRGWETTQFAQDFRTAIDWAKHRPTLAYHPTAFLAFRVHAGQWSQHPDRDVMYAEARAAQAEPFEVVD